MKNNNNEQGVTIKDVVFFSKIIYTMVCIIILYSLEKYDFWSIPASVNEGLIPFLESWLPCWIILISLLSLVYLSHKREVGADFSIYDLLECMLYIAFFVYILYESSWENSNNKFIPIFLVIIYTIELGYKVGNIIASICSFFILLPFLGPEQIDKVSPIFQQDLVLCSTFFLIVYIIGLYMRLQNKYTQELLDLSSKDALTGLFNRGYFNQFYLKKCEEDDGDLSLIILDIDHFKKYNDNNGHVQGDILLKQVSTIFKETVGDRGIVARYGGEEFVVIAPNKSYDEALLIAEDLRAVVDSTYFDFQEKQPSGNVTISVGVSSYPSIVGKSKDLLESADQSLYHSKESGRNRVTGYGKIKDKVNISN